MIDPTPERAQQAQMLEAFAEKVDGRKVMMAWEREHNVAFMEALNAGAAALRAQSAREELKTNNEKDAGAGLIGQAIPDVAGTEPRPNTTALDRLAQANAHRPKLWKCPDCHVRCRIENAPNHADTCEALQRAAHSFVGGYEIDPSQPSICQLCGKSHCAASILLSVGGPQT